MNADAKLNLAGAKGVNPALAERYAGRTACVIGSGFGGMALAIRLQSAGIATTVIEARDKPLALYIYSNDQANIDKVLSRTSSGGVTVNGIFSHYLENQLPFGGVNQSGIGSYHGVFGFKAFSHERAIYVHNKQ